MLGGAGAGETFYRVRTEAESPDAVPESYRWETVENATGRVLDDVDPPPIQVNRVDVVDATSKTVVALLAQSAAGALDDRVADRLLGGAAATRARKRVWDVFGVRRARGGGGGDDDESPAFDAASREAYGIKQALDALIKHLTDAVVPTLLRSGVDRAAAARRFEAAVSAWVRDVDVDAFVGGPRGPRAAAGTRDDRRDALLEDGALGLWHAGDDRFAKLKVAYARCGGAPSEFFGCPPICAATHPPDWACLCCGVAYATHPPDHACADGGRAAFPQAPRSVGNPFNFTST